jgi:hypothetical protein
LANLKLTELQIASYNGRKIIVNHTACFITHCGCVSCLLLSCVKETRPETGTGFVKVRIFLFDLKLTVLQTVNYNGSKMISNHKICVILYCRSVKQWGCSAYNSAQPMPMPMKLCQVKVYMYVSLSLEFESSIDILFPNLEAVSFPMQIALWRVHYRMLMQLDIL